MADRPLRIAFITPHYSPFVGGVETHVREIATNIAAMGHEVDVMTQADGPSVATSETLSGVHVRRFRVPITSAHYAFSPALMRHLARERRGYDVFHAHNYHALPALSAALAGCTPLVFTPHYHGTSESSFRRKLHIPYRAVARALVMGSARVVCVSERERSLFVRDFTRAAPRVVVIPNGVNLSRIQETTPFDVASRVILSAGRLVRYKNVEQTIRALEHLDDGFVLRVIGEGEASAELQAAASRLGVLDRVEFLGRVDEQTLYRWFRTAAVFVTMSTIEAMPVTPLEVLAAGTPVIGSDIPAHREALRVTNGDVSLIPSDASASQLADMIKAVVARPVTPATVPSWAVVAQRTLGVYQAVI